MVLARLEADRLILRPMEREDAPFILDLLQQPDWLRFIGDRGVRDLAGAESYIQKATQGFGEGSDLGLSLIERRSDAVPLGICGLLRREALDAPDLGFALSSEHTGRGYAFEASESVVEHAIEELGCAHLWAVTDPANRSSISLLDRLGFRLHGEIQLVDGGASLRAYRWTEAEVA